MKGIEERNPTVFFAHNDLKAADIIRERVCERFGLTIKDIDGRRRPNKIAHPRMLAMYLIRKNTNLTLNEIGTMFGRRDHGTVIHACKRIKGLPEDPRIESLIKSIENGEDPKQMKMKFL